MKKLFTVLCIASLFSFIPNGKFPHSNERTFTISLTETQLNDLWAVVGNSTSSYPKVVEVQTIISSQISQQVKVMDSIKNKIKKP
jgi:hypothetical protein